MSPDAFNEMSAGVNNEKVVIWGFFKEIVIYLIQLINNYEQQYLGTVLITNCHKQIQIISNKT